MGKVRFTPLAEIEVPGQRLGRHILHDEESWDHKAERAAKIVSVVHKSERLPLNQGDVGKCTAEALAGARNSDPDHKPGDAWLTDKDTDSLYSLETAMEGQPWPANDPGGTGLMVCKAAKKQGLITKYTHAFGLQHMLEALVLKPVICGVNWYDSFDNPPADAVVTLPSGATVRGGHEICADEIVAEHELIGFWQSWGPSWGLKGKFYVPYAVMERLLAEQGDVTVPIR